MSRRESCQKDRQAERSTLFATGRKKAVVLAPFFLKRLAPLARTTFGASTTRSMVEMRDT